MDIAVASLTKEVIQPLHEIRLALERVYGSAAVELLKLLLALEHLVTGLMGTPCMTRRYTTSRRSLQGSLQLSPHSGSSRPDPASRSARRLDER